MGFEGNGLFINFRQTNGVHAISLDIIEENSEPWDLPNRRRGMLQDLHAH